MPSLFLLVNIVTLNQSTPNSLYHKTIRHCRVRCNAFVGQPLSKQLYARTRGLESKESADQHATNVENQTLTDVTVKQEVADKIAVPDGSGKKFVF